jgi:energy-converting hydrogenase Eha subunit C
MYLDFINLTTVSAALTIIGAVGIIALAKPLDKVIMFALLQGGFIGMIVAANTWMLLGRSHFRPLFHCYLINCNYQNK